MSWFRRARKEAEPLAVERSQGHGDANGPAAAIAPAPRAQSPTLDYLATPVVAAFFDARECEAYYQSLKHVGTRRDFHEHYIAILARFQELTASPEGAAHVDRVMAESRHAEAAARQAPEGLPLQVAESRYPQGTKLLGIHEPVTFESLKSAYRSAALRNHPDAGGSHEAMIAVNEAFQFLHALLRERHIAEGASETDMAANPSAPVVYNCSDYRYVCGKQLFLVSLDDWNLDGAFMWLERATSDLRLTSSYAQHPWLRKDLTHPAGKLASHLALAGRRDEAERALQVARNGLSEAQREGLSYEYYVREAEDAITGRKRPRVILNHRRQADNALRLGVIDARRHKNLLERLAASAAADEAYESRFLQFQTSPGFLRDLPSDYAAKGKIKQSTFIPEPGYFVNQIAQLTDDQQGEYLIAFGDRGTLALVRKYMFVRFVSLLESVLFEPGRLDDATAEREARTLALFHSERGSARSYGTLAADLISKLHDQSSAERRERAALLDHIKKVRKSAGAVTIEFTVGGLASSPLGPPFSPSYFAAITGPLAGC